MSKGKIKWFDAKKGYGFIAPDDGGADVFVHYSVIEASGYRSLDEAQRVEFDVAQGPRGPVADVVRPISDWPDETKDVPVEPAEWTVAGAETARPVSGGPLEGPGGGGGDDRPPPRRK